MSAKSREAAKAMTAQKELARVNTHRRNPSIGNSEKGETHGSGGTKVANREPRADRGENPAAKGRAAGADRAGEHRRDEAMHSSTYAPSGMEKALSDHADKLHPVRR